MKDCGNQKIERIEKDGQKVFKVTETLIFYSAQPQLVTTFYSRTQSFFDYTNEKEL
jgi:hypothetical protein